MQRVRVAMLAVFIVFGAVAGAKAKELHADSTGGDWLMAAGEERSEWVERMARIFNKEAPFASAVEGCLTQSLAGEDIENAAVDEMRLSELPLLTAACITSLNSQPLPTQ